MALIRKFDIEQSDKQNVHKPVHRATIRTFEAADGKRYISIRSFGSATRKKPDGASQVTQLGPESIKQLKRILEEI